MFTRFHPTRILRAGIPGIALFLLLAITGHAHAQVRSANNDIYADTKWSWAKTKSDKAADKADYATAVAECEKLPDIYPGLKWTLPTQEQVESFYRRYMTKTDAEKNVLFKDWKFGDIWLLSTKTSNDNGDIAHLKDGTLSWGKQDKKKSKMIVACVTQSKPAEFKPVNNVLKTYVDNNGLTWLKPATPNNWGISSASCKDERLDNKTWRLPTVEELTGFYNQVIAFKDNADKLKGFGWKLGYSWSSEQVAYKNSTQQHYSVKLSPTTPGSGLPAGGSIHYNSDYNHKAYDVCVHD